MWKFTVHVLLKSGVENFEHYFTRVWDECNCAVVLAFFVIAFLWDWNENWPFPILWPRSGVAAKRSYPASEVRGSGCEQLPHTQGQGQRPGGATPNPKRWCYENSALDTPASLKNSAVASRLENVSLHSNPKERQWQRMLKLLHNCTLLTH